MYYNIPFSLICKSSCNFSKVLRLVLSSGIMFFLFQFPQANWKKSSQGCTDSSRASISWVAEVKWKLGQYNYHQQYLSMEWAFFYFHTAYAHVWVFVFMFFQKEWNCLIWLLKNSEILLLKYRFYIIIYISWSWTSDVWLCCFRLIVD